MKATRGDGFVQIDVVPQDAQRFAVSRDADGVQIAALPSAGQVELYMYVSIHVDSPLTLRGPFDLQRMQGGVAVENVVTGRNWVWRFTPQANHTQLANLISAGQTIGGWVCEGIGYLRPNTDYRMTIYWYSYSAPPVDSFNALQVVDFTTASALRYDAPWFQKRVATEAPEW